VDGRLFIVGTPIGNLQDITLRAIETLRSVDLIACEDTRHSKILLDKYSIKKPTTSYHKFNIKTKTRSIISRLKQGKNIALVSDAGMPGISDPGQELIKAAIDEEIRVEVIPGPSAAISALSISGLRTDKFCFEGFLPSKKSERIKALNQLSGETRTIIFYETPHRLVQTLNDIKQYLGDRNICVAREITKKFEEVSRGKVSEMIRKFTESKPRGEFVIIIEGIKGLKAKKGRKGNEEYIKLIKDMIRAGLSRNDAVKIIAKRLNVPKNELYRASLED
jgi:16S rRNA (cytidine1402-2'-O)-methyltransferase